MDLPSCLPLTRWSSRYAKWCASGAFGSGRCCPRNGKLFAFQNDISPASLLDGQGYRRIIEVGICDHILLHATKADLARLEAANACILDSSDVDAAARSDFAFHQTLVSLAVNRTLVANYRLLQPVITRIMRMGKATRPAQIDTFDAHARIIDALKSRDRVAYCYLVSRHLEDDLHVEGPGISSGDASEGGGDGLGDVPRTCKDMAARVQSACAGGLGRRVGTCGHRECPAPVAVWPVARRPRPCGAEGGEETPDLLMARHGPKRRFRLPCPVRRRGG